MAVAPLRRRAGRIDILNKERKLKEEIKAREEAQGEKKDVGVSEEEHNQRLAMLKSLGILKE